MLGHERTLGSLTAWWWSTTISAKLYQSHKVASNQFVSSIQADAGSQVQCMELCNIHDSCQALTYSTTTAACEMGSLNMASSGGAETRVWITDSD